MTDKEKLDLMTQEEAIKTVDRIFNYCEEIDSHLPENEQTGYDMYPDIRAVIEYIRNTPQVVRCKDCRYASPEGRENVYVCYAKTNPNYCWFDEYCSCGERKDNI